MQNLEVVRYLNRLYSSRYNATNSTVEETDVSISEVRAHLSLVHFSRRLRSPRRRRLELMTGLGRLELA